MHTLLAKYPPLAFGDAVTTLTLREWGLRGVRQG